MEQNRVKTPPILDWVVISLPGSSEEESDDNFPFETISSAVDKLQVLYCNEWIYQPNEAFELKRRSVGVEDSIISPRSDRNSIKSICSEILKNMKEIVRESEGREDYLEQFQLLSYINYQLKRSIGDNYME